MRLIKREGGNCRARCLGSKEDNVARVYKLAIHPGLSLRFGLEILGCKRLSGFERRLNVQEFLVFVCIRVLSRG